MRIGLVALAFLTGCPICDCDADVEVVADDGVHGIRGGEVVQLRAHSEGWDAGPDDCEGYWTINGLVGGSAEVGVIDSCGLYRAPDNFPPQLVELTIVAQDWHPQFELCFDCCPYAYRVFPIDRTVAP